MVDFISLNEVKILDTIKSQNEVKILVTIKIVCDQTFSLKSEQPRWSQGQGLKNSPRPRTDFSRTDPLGAKERNGRGQGLGTQFF